MKPTSPTSWTSPSAQATTACGRRLGALLKPGDVVALDGPLGAGKTQLVRGLAAGLGLDPHLVSSPTFVMMQEYEPSDDAPPATCPLFHLDAYRIGGPDDLASLGFDAELRATGVSVVEWAARLDTDPDALGPDVLHLELAHGANHTRTLTLTPRGRWAAQARALRAALTPAEPTP